jgi:hypothetical protein
MPTDKYTGAVTFKKSGNNITLEIAVPTGTKLKDLLKVTDVVKAAAIRKFQPGGCPQCTSGRDFRIREVDRVLPANFATKPAANVAAFDLRSGKLIQG